MNQHNQEADAAEAAWQQALDEYRSHLTNLRDHFPSHVRGLADICLHDAELLNFEEVVEPVSIPLTEMPAAMPLWSAMEIFSLRYQTELVLLIYHLTDHLRVSPPLIDWPFSTERPHWLYDELDVAPGSGGYIHSVLLSDGRTLEIPFSSLVMHRAPLKGKVAV